MEMWILLWQRPHLHLMHSCYFSATLPGSVDSCMKYVRDFNVCFASWWRAFRTASNWLWWCWCWWWSCLWCMCSVIDLPVKLWYNKPMLNSCDERRVCDLSSAFESSIARLKSVWIFARWDGICDSSILFKFLRSDVSSWTPMRCISFWSSGLECLLSLYISKTL